MMRRRPWVMVLLMLGAVLANVVGWYVHFRIMRWALLP